MLSNFIRTIGIIAIDSLTEIGRIFIFAGRGLKNCLIPPYYFKELFRQLIAMGFFSLPVVGLTAIFGGMVLALQSYTGFSRFSGESAVATVVVISFTRELGPVLAGLMVAGRMSAAIAAELGSMRVSEQIDALETLGVDPFKFLVAPRFLAGILMLPCLVLIADIIGVFGGFIVGTTKLSFSTGAYLDQTFKHLESLDVISGIVKAAFFGLSIALFGCYHGFNSQKGARGVGEATTNAVVFSCIGILILNYMITTVFFGL